MDTNMLNELDEEEEQLAAIAVVLATSEKRIQSNDINAERDIFVKEMKDKWRHIRDRFVKNFNQGKIGGPPNKKRKYIYADSLMFLLDTMEPRKPPPDAAGFKEDPPDSVYVKEETPDPDTEIDEDLAERLSNVETVMAPQTDYVHAAVQQPDYGHPAISVLSPFHSELLKKLENSACEDDADKSFLLSLLPDYKRLNDNDKLDFRFKAIQFFREVRRRQDSEGSLGDASTPSNSRRTPRPHKRGSSPTSTVPVPSSPTVPPFTLTPTASGAEKPPMTMEEVELHSHFLSYIKFIQMQQ